jgi:hypothetical protein
MFFYRAFVLQDGLEDRVRCPSPHSPDVQVLMRVGFDIVNFRIACQCSETNPPRYAVSAKAGGGALTAGAAQRVACYCQEAALSQ